MRSLTFPLSRVLSEKLNIQDDPTAKLIMSVMEYDDYFLFSSPRIESKNNYRLQGFIPIINGEVLESSAIYRPLVFHHLDDLHSAQLPAMLVLRNNLTLNQVDFQFAFDVFEKDNKVLSLKAQGKDSPYEQVELPQCQDLELFHHTITPLLDWPLVYSTFNTNASKNNYDPTQSHIIGSNTYTFEMGWNFSQSTVSNRGIGAYHMRGHKCLSCHTSQHEVFPMENYLDRSTIGTENVEGSKQLCAQFLSRVNWQNIEQSPLFKGVLQFDNHIDWVAPKTPRPDPGSLGRRYIKRESGIHGLDFNIQPGFEHYSRRELENGYQELISQRPSLSTKEKQAWYDYLMKFENTYKFFFFKRIVGSQFTGFTGRIEFNGDKNCFSKSTVQAIQCLKENEEECSKNYDEQRCRPLKIIGVPWRQATRSIDPFSYSRHFGIYLENERGQLTGELPGGFDGVAIMLAEEPFTSGNGDQKEFKFSHFDSKIFYKNQLMKWILSEKRFQNP